MDRKTGLVHHVEVTGANVNDVTVVPELLTGEETEVFGDSGYLGADKRERAITRNRLGKAIRYKINHRPSQSKNSTCFDSFRSTNQIHTAIFFYKQNRSIPIIKSVIVHWAI